MTTLGADGSGEGRAASAATSPPEGLRQGVRDALLAAMDRDAERAGAPTARRLVAAGAAGALGSTGAVILLIGHPYAHHPSWHLAAFSCLWAALLVVALALMWLRVRTPDWLLADGARAGVVALGLAGLAALFSPDPHVLHAWFATEASRRLTHESGTFASALCFGLAIALPIGAASGAIALARSSRRDGRLTLLATGWIALLLMPGIALQCVDEPVGALAGWLLGTVLGAGAGLGAAVPRWRAARPPGPKASDPGSAP